MELHEKLKQVHDKLIELAEQYNTLNRMRELQDRKLKLCINDITIQYSEVPVYKAIITVLLIDTNYQIQLYTAELHRLQGTRKD